MLEGQRFVLQARLQADMVRLGLPQGLVEKPKKVVRRELFHENLGHEWSHGMHDGATLVLAQGMPRRNTTILVCLPGEWR